MEQVRDLSGEAGCGSLRADSLRIEATFLPDHARPMTPRPVQHGGGVKLDKCPIGANRCSVLRVRADCGGRPFTAKLGIVVHNLAHQLLNQLLANDAILLARQFCDGLCDRVGDLICSSATIHDGTRCRANHGSLLPRNDR